MISKQRCMGRYGQAAGAKVIEIFHENCIWPTFVTGWSTQKGCSLWGQNFTTHYGPTRATCPTSFKSPGCFSVLGIADKDFVTNSSPNISEVSIFWLLISGPTSHIGVCGLVFHYVLKLKKKTNRTKGNLSNTYACWNKAGIINVYFQTMTNWKHQLKKRSNRSVNRYTVITITHNMSK